jgi:general secretion pathway protein I
MNRTRRHGAGARQGQQGFSLLEVLVALSIVSISLGILFQVVSGSLRLSFRARQHQAVWVDAMEAFSEVLPSEFDWEKLEREGVDDDSSWTIEIHPVALRSSLEDVGISSVKELFKFVFVYRDLASNKTVRIASYRTVETDSLRDFLEGNRDRLFWDEHEGFSERVRQ